MFYHHRVSPIYVRIGYNYKYHSIFLLSANDILVQVNYILGEQKKIGKPVAGIIVEPIQSEGGDNHASKEFFQKLQRLAKQVIQP